ncbi:MAG: glycosyltransferase family 4 protein [Candidatus Hydrogenedentes bacterium]|nr:glycosyltransferase family 4 protein [Candidatus Hydrogenedentota bacterium]
MNLALLMGNRYSAWHLQGFHLLRGEPAITAFRAESQIQDHFSERGDGTEAFNIERIYFDTQSGNPIARTKNVLLERYASRAPRIVPFHDRLQGFDVIHSWELFTDWSAEAALARERFDIPLVVTVWDLIPFNMERDSERRAIKCRVAEKADRFVVYTERSRRTLEIEGIGEERIAQVNPGVDLEKFSPKPTLESKEEFVILFVGWLVPRKGIDFLLLALRELFADPELKGRRIRLQIVGSGAGRDRVERLIARLGIGDACTFSGALTYDQMPEAFRGADAFVLPSIATGEWQEQFGMSLIEAMACGLPCVATLSGAIEEIAGDCAVLCQPNDFLALYQSLRDLILDPSRANDLGQRARRRVEERFDLRQHAGALSNVYDSLLQ